MAQQFTAPQFKTRTALLVFIKGSAAPIVLYTDNPQATYEELQPLMKSPTATLIEKDAQGPIKKACFMSNQIAGMALQEEQYV